MKKKKEKEEKMGDAQNANPSDKMLETNGGGGHMAAVIRRIEALYQGGVQAGDDSDSSEGSSSEEESEEEIEEESIPSPSYAAGPAENVAHGPVKCPWGGPTEGGTTRTAFSFDRISVVASGGSKLSRRLEAPFQLKSHELRGT